MNNNTAIINGPISLFDRMVNDPYDHQEISLANTFNSTDRRMRKQNVIDVTNNYYNGKYCGYIPPSIF